MQFGVKFIISHHDINIESVLVLQAALIAA